MKKICRALVMFCAVLMIASCANMQRKNLDPTMMVIPSRYTIVQFAFDIARLRPVTLVAFDKSGGEDVLLHIWNPSLQEWVRISMDDYAQGGLTDPAAARVIVLGGEEDVPEGILGASQWCPQVEQISSLQILNIVNGLDDFMRFSSAEWKYLAKRHNLTIKDFNYERRRYGRYGKPGDGGSAPMPEDDVVVEEIIEEPMPPAPAEEVSAPEPMAPVAAEIEDDVPALVAPEDK